MQSYFNMCSKLFSNLTFSLHKLFVNVLNVYMITISALMHQLIYITFLLRADNYYSLCVLAVAVILGWTLNDRFLPFIPIHV